MNEYNKYAALANTIKIEDITSCETKQNILKNLKDNDRSFTQLWISSRDQVVDELDYDFDSAEDLAWLGYYLGQSTNVNHLHIRHSPPASYGVEVFRRGIGNNKSIKTLNLGGGFSFEGSVLSMLDKFLKNNNKLVEIDVEGGELGVEGARQFSLALGGCSKSLKVFSIYDESNIEDGQLVDIITALSMHPQLTELRLSDVHMGRNECMALSTLLRWTTNKLQKLSLYDDGIDDEGLEILTNALTNVNTLKELYLGGNALITLNGWKVVATLLGRPSSKIHSLDVSNNNNFGDDWALVFTNALSGNSTLKHLSLYGNGITTEGWVHFSKLLCDTSTVNKTFMSNHTLQSIGCGRNGFPGNLQALLALNRGDNKRQVAMSKILQHHSHFDVQPFFEWEFKVLPNMVNWFTKAAASTTDEYDEKVKKMKLSAVYDFIRGLPMLYVEARTREEIKNHTSLEMQIQRAQLRLQREQMQLASQLEEVQQCKARAMRRL